jgi:hypothetical protein
VTFFGIFFTPVFYEVIRRRTDRRAAERRPAAAPAVHEAEPRAPRVGVS